MDPEPLYRTTKKWLSPPFVFLRNRWFLLLYLLVHDSLAKCWIKLFEFETILILSTLALLAAARQIHVVGFA